MGAQNIGGFLVSSRRVCVLRMTADETPVAIHNALSVRVVPAACHGT